MAFSLGKIFSIFRDKTPHHIKKGKQLIEELRRESGFDAVLVKRLISEGASLELTDVLGRTALHIAIVDHKDIVPDILLQNPPLDVKDSFGRTPLFSAVMEGNEEIVKTLVNRNPDSVLIPNGNNDTPLNRAAEDGNLRLVQLLIGAGAEINRKGRWGNTPLMSAAEKGHRDVISYLLDEKADPSITNEKGRTALEILNISQNSGYYWHRGSKDDAGEKLQAAIDTRKEEALAQQERAAEEQRQEIVEELKNGGTVKEPLKKRPSINFD